MRKLLFSYGVSFAFVVCLLPHSARAAGKMPAAGRASIAAASSPVTPPSARPPVQAPEDVLRAKLKNGLRVVIVRNRLAPVVTTMVNYLVGSNEVPPGFPGMAHAQEHMMFRGSPGLSADQLAEISAAMGGSFDADTQQTITQYFFTIPAEDLDLALHIEAVRMSGVEDSEKQWDQERGAIKQEVAQDHSNPFEVFYEKMLAALYQGTPLANSGLGTRPTFDKTTAAMLKKFYDAWYAPNNAILVIVGDVNPASALGEVKRLFSDIPSKQLPPRPAVHLEPVKAATLNIPSDYPFGLAAIAFRMPGTDSPDFAAADVLSDVLSSQRGSLYALVPHGKALFAEFDLQALPQSGFGLAIVGYPKGADADALVKEVRQILSDDLQHGVPADLVAAAKLHELAHEEMQKNSVSGLANEWSEAVAVEGRRSPEDDIRMIEAVTPEQVNRVARKYLRFNHAITAILPPQPSGKPISHSSFGGAESFAPKHVKAVPLPAWAAEALARLTVPRSTVNPVVSSLPNGIKLIVQPESVSNTVSVFGHIKNNPDLEVPKGQEGASSVLDRLFSFGTTTLGRLQFQKALDDIGADESAGTNFTLEVLSSHFDRGVELLADNEIHPALPPTAFAIMEKQQAAFVAGQLQSPSYLASRARDAALFPKDDPTLRQATPHSVMGLTLQDVKEYYQHAFRPDLTTIVVIGKVTPEAAKSVIEKYFGGWEASGPKPRTDLPPVPLNQPSATTVPDKSRVQDSVTLAETLRINRFSPDYYALQLGNEVLGGGFYASRLGQDLRETTGLVYYVGSSLAAGKTRSVYSVSYGCNPPNVSKARAIVVRDLKAMQTTAVDARQLRQAKALLLRQIPLSESDVSSIGHEWIALTDLGLPLDEPVIAGERYLNLTAQQVKDAFTRWVRPSDLVQVVQGPNPQ
jgi:zinc protease